MLPMVDHELGHAAIDADIFAGDKACLVGAEEQRHFGNIVQLAHWPTGCWVASGPVISELVVSIQPGEVLFTGLCPQD